MAAPILFKEKQRTFLIHDYLVYVCGVEVSRFIEDISITFNDRNSPNSCDFSVTNAMDQFFLTFNNLVRNQWRKTGDRYSEAAKYKIYTAKRHLSQRVSGGKVLQVNSKANLPDTDYTKLSSPELVAVDKALAAEFQNQDFLERYAFGVGSCIFSRFDTVRVFIKNPYDHPDMDRWIPFFTGTIQNKPATTDYITGASRINISAMDVRAEMSGMRVSTNPVSNDMFREGNSNEADQRASTVFFDSEQAGFFKDLYPTEGTNKDPAKQARNLADNIFDNKAFVDMVSMLITGTTGWVGRDLSYDKAKAGTGGVISEGTGVGFFKPGQVIRYGNSKNTNLTKKDNFRDSLEEWDNICLFGKNQRFFSRQDCEAMGRASFWYKFDSNTTDSKRELTRFTPFDGYMHFLMPAEGLKIASMIVQSFDGFKNITKNPDWTNRFELITRVCQMVDYEWSVTGNGDIIFEFPMYDFYPESFGANSSIYISDMHLQNDTIADESGEIPAAIEATTSLTTFGSRQEQEALNRLSENGAVAPSNIARTVVVSPILASKYGAKVVSHSFTGVPVEGLAKAATIEFQKRLADANKLSFNFTYRPFLRPNRPLLHAPRGRMGKTTSVSYSIPTFPSEPTVGVSVHCVRTPLFKDGKNIFQHITGAANMPLSYNAIFEKADIDTDGGMAVVGTTTNTQGKSVSNTANTAVSSTEEPLKTALSPTNNPNWNRFDHLFQKYGAKYGIDPDVLKAISLNESQLGTDRRTRVGVDNPSNIRDSVSEDGKSWGIMQVTYRTAKEYDPKASAEKLNNPEYSVDLAARHLAKSYKAFDKLEYVIKSYNRGIQGTKNDIASGSFNGHVQEYWERFNRNLGKVQNNA